MTHPYAAAALLAVVAIVASGAPLDLAGATPAESGCVRLEHEWNGGVQRYRANLLAPGEPPTTPDDPCPANTAPTFRLLAPACLDLSMEMWTHSPLNGAPPWPTTMRLYVVPNHHPERHGSLGRDAWFTEPVLVDEMVGEACLPAGDHRLVIRSCRYGPTPLHPASQPQCDGVFVYDINTDDGGATLPIYTVTHG